MTRGYGTTTVNSVTGSDEVFLRIFIWVTAKNRSTGADETIGIWNGDDTTTVTIDGASRTYYGAGNMLGVDPVEYRAGLDVMMRRVTVSSIAPEVETLIRTYDPRLAAAEVHRGRFTDGALVEEPHQLYAGNVDSVEFITGADGSDSTAIITIASSTRELTRALSAKYSDETMQVMATGDKLFKYADISDGEAQWGG